MKSLGKERSSTGVVKGWKVHYLPGRALKGRSVQGVQTDAHEFPVPARPYLGNLFWIGWIRSLSCQLERAVRVSVCVASGGGDENGCAALRAAEMALSV